MEAQCETEAIQKAPEGTFCIAFALHLASNAECKTTATQERSCRSFLVLLLSCIQLPSLYTT